LIELCQLKTANKEPFDGRSLAPLLANPAGTLTDRKLVIQYGAELKDWDSAVLWNQWRLVKGVELYDLTADPMQAKDLAKTRPDILAELRSHYESWLATTRQIAGRPNHLVVGTPQESPTVLTAADWIGPFCGEWGELKESAQPKFGAWDIEAGVTDNYEIRLYFFPPESGRRLNEAFRSAPARPVAGASLRLDDREFTVQTSPDATHARFEVRLQQGERRRVEGRLLDATGRLLWGAIYVTIERMDR
jgi:hypothetical protein